MKILIVTYTFPPSKSVNSQRPYYFANTLLNAGHQVHILTRHFTGQERQDAMNTINKTPFSLTIESGIHIYRVPFKNAWFWYDRWTFGKRTGIWHLIYFIQLLSGRLSQESYNKWFQVYLSELIKSNRYDRVIVESGPTNLVRLVSKVCTCLKLPYLIDFRDAYYHDMYRKDQRFISMNRKLKIFFEKHYMVSSIRHALKCITLNNQMGKILSIPEDKLIIIPNGYDEGKWELVERSFKQGTNARFQILIGGKVYNLPFLQTMLETLRIFLTFNPKDTGILFIAPGSSEVINMIRKNLPYPEVKIIEERIGADSIIQAYLNSHVLLYHGWPGYTGCMSTKIYDYIRSGKPILIVPNDHDVIEDLLNDTKLGICMDSPGEAAEILLRWYTSWKRDGFLNSDFKKSDVGRYARTAFDETLQSCIN